VKGFNKCHISNAEDETDKNMLWNEREEEGNIGSECEEYVGNDCEDGDSNTEW
jgi:hypothetical protein